MGVKGRAAILVGLEDACRAATLSNAMLEAGADVPEELLYLAEAHTKKPAGGLQSTSDGALDEDADDSDVQASPGPLTDKAHPCFVTSALH